MAIKDEEEERLRSVALQNAQSINLARRRAEETLRKQSEWLRVTLSILANHTILIAKDGTEYPIDDSAAPIRNDQGEVAGVVLVFRDITSRKVEEAAQTERTRLVALRGDVSAALASSQSTPSALELCCEAFILHLNVAFAGIWTLRGPDSALESQARAGLRIDLTGLPEQIPVGQFNIGMVVRTREPYLTNAVADDPNVSNAEWAKREGLIAFAGYPLIVEDLVVGVVALFARHSMTEGVLTELAPLAEGIAQYIDRKRTGEQLRQQAEFLRVTLASIGDAVLTTNTDGNVTYLNSVAQDVTGWSQEDAAGKPLTSVFHIINEKSSQPTANPVERVLREGRVVGLPNYTTLIAKDGQAIPVDDSTAPIRDHDGKIIGAVVVFRDITERKKLEAERERLLLRAQVAQLQAEQANRLKDEFLATASHELRTPLTAVVGWSRMLRGGRLDQENSERALESIERNANLLTKLIEDLLDTSRIITGKLSIDRQPTELALVIDDALNTVRPAVDAKNITIETSIDAQAGPVMGDANRLQQVVWNLLSNAVKFTPKNGHINVLLRRIDSEIEISVRDSGEGISPEFLPYVFERFLQADGRKNRKHGGLGLGLAIVRHLIELHGGTVKAHSDGRRRGATFTVRLPIVGVHTIAGGLNLNSAEPLPQTDALNNRGPRIEGLPELHEVRVLIVDDDRDTRELLKAVLLQCQAEDRELALLRGYQVHLSKPVDPAEFVRVVARLAGRNS